jgi:hypothetical protein
MPGILIKLVLLSVLKKVAVFAVAKTYGFPRLYRRIMELNRKMFHGKRAQQVWFRDRVQYIFRLPRIVYQRFRNRTDEAKKAGLLACFSTAAPGYWHRFLLESQDQASSAAWNTESSSQVIQV